MENKDIKDIVETMAKSMDNTQKNAANTECLTKQISDLSGTDIHKQIIDGIIADNNTDWEEKVNLIQKVNTDYDQREENNTRRVIKLQSCQTQNVGIATSWWTEHWEWLAFGGLIFIGVATPGGRKFISTATKYLLTA